MASEVYGARASYAKPVLTPEQQVELLKSRGMTFKDKDSELAAAGFLAHTSYFRLSGYWYELREWLGPDKVPERSDNFIAGTNWDDVLKFYRFDAQLRAIIFDHIGKFEVAFRAAMSTHLADTYGAFAHLDSNVFKKVSDWARTTTNLIMELNRSDEDFAKHFRRTYSQLLPPIWATLELATLGELNAYYFNLKEKRDRESIAKLLGLHDETLISWAKHANQLRNKCAHHARIWNRRFTAAFTLPKKLGEHSDKFNSADLQKAKIYNSLVMLDYFQKLHEGDSDLLSRVEALLAEFPEVPRAKLGYPLPAHKTP